MEITDALIDKLATLSRLRFDAEGKEEIRQDLQRMIGFISKLEELDTSADEPLLHISQAVHVLRPDIVEGEASSEETFRNATKHRDGYFIVPKVINRENSAS